MKEKRRDETGVIIWQGAKIRPIDDFAELDRRLGEMLQNENAEKQIHDSDSIEQSQEEYEPSHDVQLGQEESKIARLRSWLAKIGLKS